MSDALCLVRFPDGELRVAYFFGGPGLTVPFLFPLDEAAAVWADGMEPLMERMASLDDAPTPADVEDVEIWADYGDPFWWEGRASRTAGLLVSGIDPHGITEDEPGGEGVDITREYATLEPFVDQIIEKLADPDEP